MTKAKEKTVKTRRSLLLATAVLLSVAAIILLFLGLRASGWAAKKENMQLLTLVIAENTVFDPVIREALVTRGLQEERFEARVQELLAQGLDEESARAEAAKTVQPAGYSEHELGLAVDLADDDLDEDEQEDSEMFVWLEANAWRYGFILRYPDGMSGVTGVGYVPWHYRYVGREAAQQIWELGLTLEEYIELFYPEQ